jgi:hypothetical protein
MRSNARLRLVSDWAADTVHERARRLREASQGRGKGTLHGWALALVSACQSWVIVALAGVSTPSKQLDT